MNKETEISKEVKEDINKGYQTFLKERKELLSSLGLTENERNNIEQAIRIKIKTILLKSKGNYFSYDPYLEIKEIEKYFQIIVTSGDRNIGKTTSAKANAKKVVENGKRFMIMRSMNTEIEQQIKSEANDWFKKENWDFTSIKNPDIYDGEGRLIGWYRDVNTIGKFKSIEFPDLEYVVYEEFNSRVHITDKYAKFVEFITTAQRHRPNLKIILQSNYVDQNDEMLQALGVGLEEIKHDVIFNWISGTILIFIPKGIYKSVGNKKTNKGYRLSLNKYSVWKSQYGGGFNNETPINIINLKEISSMKPIFNLFFIQNTASANKTYGAYRVTLFKVFDGEGKPHNVFLEGLENNNAPIFTFDHYNKILYPRATLISLDVLNTLIDKWNRGKIKTVDMNIHSTVTSLFSKGLKTLESTKNIYEIEEL